MNRLESENRPSSSNSGYALLAAVIAVAIFSVLILAARNMWETEIRRDLEEELIFRARQYVTAIELYKKKNTNLHPQNLEVLLEKKFIRKLFKDPMTESGVWNVVMRGGRGGKSALLIVPEELVPQYISRAMIIGVCSTSPEEGFREYRKKKKYNEWAIYLGEQVDKDMPELKYVGESEPGEEEQPGQTDQREQEVRERRDEEERR